MYRDETSELFLKHSGCFRGPKNPSAAIRLTSKLCGKSSVGHRAPVGDPKNPSQNLQTFIEPPRKPSAALRVIVRARRPGRSLVSLHLASREPGFDLRKASKLRRAQILTAVRKVSSWSLSMNVRAASGIRRDHPRFIGPFPSSVRSSSASLRGVLGIRRTPLQHIDPRPRPGWNPSVKLRSASKLRRARHRTITSHRSPAKPSNKRPGHVKTPKSPSLTHQLEVELRVEPSDERRARLQPPKRPST